MKTNITMNSKYIECTVCGCDVEPYDHELIDADGENIRICFRGWCPNCHKEYTYESKFQFISGVITNIS